jgi:2-keto-4-pentenoate hydratase/2-oxohepta-3-ene-1,7-dioic acid hydratase in catechol pathway
MGREVTPDAKNMKSLTWLLAIAMVLLSVAGLSSAQEKVTKYVRYAREGKVSYGRLEGSVIHELNGNFLASTQETGNIVRLSDVRLLPPTEPSKVIAVGLNYRSHAGMSGAAAPGLFAKLPSSLVGHEAPIVIPSGSDNLHYEGELVVVIAKKAKNVSAADAPMYIFGVTAGNDVSERGWQSSDLQWLRAKASDTFGPVGPAVVKGLNYNDLLVQTRLNGTVKQSESTKNLIHSISRIVSYVSRYFTLLPGDLIFTGTPGSTSPMKAGDVVEIKVEGVGVLRNPVVPDPSN